MVRKSLNGLWNMSWEGNPDGEISGSVPGSVYSFLMDAGLMEDPFYRDNELEALRLMERDYSFTRKFDLPESLIKCRNQIIRFDGIDTIADIYLNGTLLGHADNMHCTWEFSVAGLLRPADNLLKACLYSPTKFIREKDAEHHLGGSRESMAGFPHLRKAHFMFGWDWGPRLPDQGIWRNVSIIGWNEARIVDVRIHQEIRTSDGVPINEAEDGWKAARSGEVEAQLTVGVDFEESRQLPGLSDKEESRTDYCALNHNVSDPDASKTNTSDPGELNIRLISPSVTSFCSA